MDFTWTDFYIIWRQTSKTIQSRMGTGGNFMSFGNSGAKIYADADIKQRLLM